MTDALIKPMTCMTLPEKLDYIRKDLIEDGAIQRGSAWDTALTEAIQALSGPGDAEREEVIAALEKLSKRWPEQVLPRAISLLRRPVEPVVTPDLNASAAMLWKITSDRQYLDLCGDYHKAESWAYETPRRRAIFESLSQQVVEAALNVSQPGVK